MSRAHVYNQKIITFFIMILNIPAAMSIDEHAPSLPAMSSDLDSSASSMQLTISLYMLGMAISQWICGALSDRFGRKPVLLSTAGIYLLATLLCLFSTDLAMLLLGRFLQGVGAGTFAMIAPALMGEALEKKNVAKVSAYFSMSYAMIPILAPVIGGYIQEFTGWRGNFVFMFAVTLLITLFALIKLPETHQPTLAHKLDLPRLFLSYRKVLTNRRYITAVVAMIFAWSTIIAFSVLGPFLLQNTLDLAPYEYGRYALLVGLGFLLGNYFHTFLTARYGAKKTNHAALTGAILICAIQFVLVALGHFNLSIAMIPSFLLMGAVGLIFPSLYGTAATTFTENIGIASSLIGCLILLGAVILTMAISLLPAHVPLTLPTVYLVLMVLCAGAVYKNKSVAS